MRRLSGHDHVHFENVPRPAGSLLSRRAMLLPASLKLPEKIQQPQAVVPSSRNAAKLTSCLPFCRIVLVASFGSGTSASAEPLSSRASSSAFGSLGSL